MDKRTFKICEAVHLGLDYFMNKWVIIGAIGNIALVVLNAINQWRHW